MIKVSHLTRRFGRFTAVDDVSFRLERGEVVGFLGPNGAGKTTIMRMLTGFLPPTRGSVEVAGFDLTRRSLAVRRHIGYLPESVPLYGEHRVEEMLRFDAPSQYQGRITMRDVEIHGCTIPRGARVIFVTGAACHDEREFENPDVFDITRRPERNLYFGYGHHFCIGKSLARLETRVAFEEISKSFPEYELVEGGLARNHQAHVRGYSSVQITF